MARSAAALRAKSEREAAAAALKRHNELVKQADKLLKKKGGSREAALHLLQEAFKLQHSPSTLLKVAELQYQLDRFAAAAANAELLVRSQPSAAHLAQAEILLRKCGPQAEIHRKSADVMNAIDGHLDAVLSLSTTQLPGAGDPWESCAISTGGATDPWSSHEDRVERVPSTDVISKADALFMNKTPTQPSYTAVTKPSGNSFTPDDSSAASLHQPPACNPFDPDPIPTAPARASAQASTLTSPKSRTSHPVEPIESNPSPTNAPSQHPLVLAVNVSNLFSPDTSSQNPIAFEANVDPCSPDAQPKPSTLEPLSALTAASSFALVPQPVSVQGHDQLQGVVDERDESDRASGGTEVLEEDSELLSLALASLSRIAQRVEDLASAGPVARDELRGLVHALAKLNDSDV
mmetsp:Transcript_15206/g.42402  ORF Transcript_15206/g.42402 Transcript_15206/m.42402 type:complete len:407 (+) Transcript_15206:108-1328(+)